MLIHQSRWFAHKLHVFANYKFSSMVIVRNLPKTWSAADIVGNFNDKRVTKINFIKNKQGEKTGKAILHYRSDKDAEVAIKQNHGRNIFDEYLVVEPYQSDAAQETRKGAVDTDFKNRLNRRLYIQNLPADATKDDVFALTKDVSEVEEIRFPRTDDGRSKGYSIVYLSKADHVANAINFLHNKKVLGTRLHVSDKLNPIKIMEESRLADKLEYVQYIKRKYHSTLKEVDVDHVPSLRITIKEIMEKQTNEDERKAAYHQLMSKEDKTLESVAELAVLQYREFLRA